MSLYLHSCIDLGAAAGEWLCEKNSCSGVVWMNVEQNVLQTMSWTDSASYQCSYASLHVVLHDGWCFSESLFLGTPQSRIDLFVSLYFEVGVTASLHGTFWLANLAWLLFMWLFPLNSTSVKRADTRRRVASSLKMVQVNYLINNCCSCSYLLPWSRAVLSTGYFPDPLSWNRNGKYDCKHILSLRIDSDYCGDFYATSNAEIQTMRPNVPPDKGCLPFIEGLTSTLHSIQSLCTLLLSYGIFGHAAPADVQILWTSFDYTLVPWPVVSAAFRLSCNFASLANYKHCLAWPFNIFLLWCQVSFEEHHMHRWVRPPVDDAQWVSNRCDLLSTSLSSKTWYVYLHMIMTCVCLFFSVVSHRPNVIFSWLTLLAGFPGMEWRDLLW